jgi:hypothetical protein
MEVPFGGLLRDIQFGLGSCTRPFEGYSVWVGVLYTSIGRLPICGLFLLHGHHSIMEAGVGARDRTPADSMHSSAADHQATGPSRRYVDFVPHVSRCVVTVEDMRVFDLIICRCNIL